MQNWNNLKISQLYAYFTQLLNKAYAHRQIELHRKADYEGLVLSNVRGNNTTDDDK